MYDVNTSYNSDTTPFTGKRVSPPEHGNTFPFAQLKPYTRDSNQSPQGELIINSVDIP